MDDEINMNEDTESKLSSVGKKYFKLIEFDKDEKFICEIRKHPIGLFFIYLTGISIAIILAFVFGIVGFTGFLSSALEGTDVSVAAVQGIVTLVGAVMLLGIIGIMIIQAILYENNVIFVTSEKIAQVLYISLFNRKISQLSIGDVQDVTVTQKGILPNMFNYGVLVIETAGEQQNYTFTFVPDPYRHSKAIVGTHEENLKLFGN